MKLRLAYLLNMVFLLAEMVSVLMKGRDAVNFTAVYRVRHNYGKRQPYVDSGCLLVACFDNVANNSNLAK